MTEAAARPDSAYPRWLREVDSALPISSQFVLSGNIRDLHLIPSVGRWRKARTIEALWACLEASEFECLLIYDPVDSLNFFPHTAQAREAANAVTELTFIEYETLNIEGGLVELSNIARLISGSVGHRAALVLDYASRMVQNPPRAEGERPFLLSMEKLAHEAKPAYKKGVRSVQLYNPVIWLVDHERDLPTWLTVGNRSVRTISVPLPDYDQRYHMAQSLAPALAGTTAVDLKPESCHQLAKYTEGMSLLDMRGVMWLAKDQEISLGSIDDAVRGYRLGIIENPWKRSYLRERITEARAALVEGRREHLTAQVYGQNEAIGKVLDILIRSTMGLTGAHSAKPATGPRGVLFFAGPTGVGKTELAKAIAALVFEREEAYIRFDMSEFAAPHTDARLIGAPPGYIGHDSGGELTNAVRERPFSLILFDEIEKADPTILDKFLQILEDGRLSDGRGNTVSFTETLIVFTSNLGLYRADENRPGNFIRDETLKDSRPALEEGIRKAIEEHFTTKSNRPEILNRIGLGNIVVFNFIDDTVARDLVRLYTDNVIARVQREHSVQLEVEPAAFAKIVELATGERIRDFGGGRAIATELSAAFIEPLGRALFERDIHQGEIIRVVDICGGEVVLK